ncbi:MAG: hypothetical protein KGP29_00005, partial [Proteobacteria bacterium]|nr:hypothetical protein [Pseudomonadota bacterium]
AVSANNIKTLRRSPLLLKRRKVNTSVEELDKKAVEKNEYDYRFSLEDWNSNSLERGVEKSDSIPEIRGNKAYYYYTGLEFQDFSGQGSSGLHDFSHQAVLATDTPDSKKTRVSFARIKLQSEDSDRHLFCVVNSDADGLTTNFVNEEDISDIVRRSEEIYKQNLEYLARLEGIKQATIVLNNVRVKLLKKSKDPSKFLPKKKESSEESSQKKVRVEGLSEYLKKTNKEISFLRSCVEKCEINENDSPHDIRRKMDLLNQKYKDFDDEKYFGFLNVSTQEDYSPITSQIGEEDKARIRLLLSAQHSTEDHRSSARQMTHSRINRELSDEIERSKRDNQYKFRLSEDEMGEILSYYNAKNSALTSLFGGKSKFDMRQLEELLALENPYSPNFNGASVCRPKGYNEGRVPRSLVTVTLNEKSDKFLWLELPSDCEGRFVKVTKIQEDGMVSVYRNGVPTWEEHRRGDLVIDTGVVFEKVSDGVYTAIAVNKLGDRAKKAYGDFRVKAVSIDGGQASKVAILYNGESKECKLVAKSSPFQEGYQKYPTLKEKELSKLNLEYKFIEREGGYKEVVLDQSDFKEVEITDNNGRKINITELQQELSQLKLNLEELRKELSLAFGKTFSKDFEDPWNDIGKVSIILRKIIDEHTQAKNKALREANRKYAVIGECGEFNIVVMAEINSLTKPTIGNIKIDFLFPEIQIYDPEQKKFLYFPIFQEDEDIVQETKDKLKNLSDKGALKGLLSKLYKESEIKGFNFELDYQSLCLDLRRHCNEAVVGVSLQKVEKDELKGGYKESGDRKLERFASTVKLPPKNMTRDPFADSAFRGLSSPTVKVRG